MLHSGFALGVRPQTSQALLSSSLSRLAPFKLPPLWHLFPFCQRTPQQVTPGLVADDSPSPCVGIVRVVPADLQLHRPVPQAQPRAVDVVLRQHQPEVRGAGAQADAVHGGGHVHGRRGSRLAREQTYPFSLPSPGPALPRLFCHEAELAAKCMYVTCLLAKLSTPCNTTMLETNTAPTAL